MSSSTEPSNLDVLPQASSIAAAVDSVGQRWTIPILRELSNGVRRFTAIQANTGAPRDTLSRRLRKLEDSGLIDRWESSDRPGRHEYHLTEAGEDFSAVLRALQQWGANHVEPTCAVLRRA